MKTTFDNKEHIIKIYSIQQINVIKIHWLRVTVHKNNTSLH